MLRGARNLEALSIWANAAPCLPVLGSLPKLRFLEITLFYNSHDWLDGLFDDLGFCYSLESLRITQAIPREAVAVSGKLPEVQLSTLPNLKRVELVQWFPDAAFSLPPDCELCVTVFSGSCFSEKHWEAMQRHLKVLTLADMGEPNTQSWLGGFGCLSQLQYLQFESGVPTTFDLAALKAVPHVELYLDDTASLTLTDGAWQSIEVHGRSGLSIAFTDADAFVRGTQRFLFLDSGEMRFLQPMCTTMCTTIREACSRQFISCYECKFVWQTWHRHAIRLSNCEEVMRLEPSHDGMLRPSGGLHDGYAGTPEDSPLWNCIGNKTLASKEEFWPEWNPHKWVFGE